MGRNRRPEDRWMPVRVYRGKSQYEFRPKGGKVVTLCPLGSEQSAVWLAYERAVTKSALTVDKMADAYFESRWFLRRRPSTQRQYRDCWKMLAKVWTGVDAGRVRQKHVRQWMDLRGQTSEVSANREYSVLCNIFAHGFERSQIRENPCRGVKKFPETPREKYIEDDEYYSYLEKSTRLIQIVMELSYLPASRGQNVRKLTLADKQDKGIFIHIGKRGKKQIKEWTPRLRDAWDAALQLRREIMERQPDNVLSPYLVVNSRGQPYTESGLKTMWAKNRKRIELEHGIKIDWTYHDIKAKGVSDFTGDKQAFSGLKTPRMVQVYDRKAQVVPTLQTDRRPLQG